MRWTNRTIMTAGAVALIGATACTQTTEVVGPKNAPIPTNAEMTFVDETGCSWWVIGNATSLSWAPMTRPGGEQVCDEGATRLALPGSEPAPIVSAAVAAPVAATVPTATGRAYFVQVASFAEQANAQASSRVFNGRGLPVTTGSLVREASGFYRLVLGPFANQTEAQNAVRAANTEGFADAFFYVP